MKSIFTLICISEYTTHFRSIQRRLIGLTCCFFVALGADARAVQVIGHDSNYYSIANNNGNPEASTFTTGAGTWQVTGFSFWTAWPVYQDTVTTHLYANAGGSPGTELWTSSPVNAYTGQMHFDVLGVTLTGNTQYWLGVTVGNSTYFKIETDMSKFSTSDGFAVLPGFLENKGQGWIDNNPGRSLALTFGVEAVPVPEPSSLSMLSFGLLGLASLRRRQR